MARAQKAAYQRTRPKTAELGYGWRWQKARKAWLASHPLCVRCEDNNKVTLATVVDHIKPHRGDMTLFWDHTNWQSLCTSCHNRKTATEDSQFGNIT